MGQLSLEDLCSLGDAALDLVSWFSDAGEEELAAFARVTDELDERNGEFCGPSAPPAGFPALA